MDKNSETSKSEIAYIEIRRIITEFLLIPGQTICIKQLSDFLSFSTTPLREALFGLEKDGYVAKNRKDSFYVTQVDGDYVRNLFEYGKILYINAIGDCCRHRNHDQYNNINLLRNDTTALFDIDHLYQRAQDRTKNHFLCKQMSVFRIKAKSIRTALFHSNKELSSAIYGDVRGFDTFEYSSNKFFEETHLKKIELAEYISQSTMSYAALKSKSCKIINDIYPLKDFVK